MDIIVLHTKATKSQLFWLEKVINPFAIGFNKNINMEQKLNCKTTLIHKFDIWNVLIMTHALKYQNIFTTRQFTGQNILAIIVWLKGEACNNNLGVRFKIVLYWLVSLSVLYKKKSSSDFN